MAELNPGIRRLVALLQTAGFETTDSGDGETHDHECDRPTGYVVAVVRPADLVDECHRLKELLVSWLGGLSAINDEGLPAVQGSYDPVTCVAVIEIVNVHDRMLREADLG